MKVCTDLVLLLSGLAVGAVEAGLNSPEEDWQRCAEQHDVTKRCVEAALVPNRAGHDDGILRVEEGPHPRLVPGAVRQDPATVIGVQNVVSTSRELDKDRRPPGAGHAGDQDASHALTLTTFRDGKESYGSSRKPDGLPGHPVSLTER